MPSSAARSRERFKTLRSVAATARPSTCCAIIESTICIWRSYSVSCAGPFHSTSTPNFWPAAAAPVCTDTQNTCELALGTTAIRLLRLPRQDVSASKSAASGKTRLLSTPTSVHHNVGSSDEAGVFRAQVLRELADLLGLAPAFHRSFRHELLVYFGIGHERDRHLGGERSGTDRHHSNALGSELECQRSREAH